MYKKIDLYTRRRFKSMYYDCRYEYCCSTNTYTTCKQAKHSFCVKHGLSSDQVKACFAKQ